MTTIPLPSPRQNLSRRLPPALIKSMRGWADVLSLWRLCMNGKCRRARACRGDPIACRWRNFPLLPDDVQAWAFALAEAQQNEVPVDEAFERIGNSPEGEAFSAWCEAVKQSLSGGRGGA
jgi:hypothetical protein